MPFVLPLMLFVLPGRLGRQDVLKAHGGVERLSFRKLLPNQPDVCPTAEIQLSFFLYNWASRVHLAVTILLLLIFLKNTIFT